MGDRDKYLEEEYLHFILSPSDLFDIFKIKSRIFNTLFPICNICIYNQYSVSLENGSEKQTSFRLTTTKINHAFLDLLSDEDSQIQFTPLILSHIRTLSLELNNETVDKKLVYRLSQNFLKQKETMLSEQYDPTIVTNFLWLLQTYAHNLKDSPYFLEEITDYLAMDDKSVHRERGYFFYCRLLTTAVHIFSYYPSETQHVIGKIFELCKDQNSPELEEKVVFYSRLIRCDSFYGAVR